MELIRGLHNLRQRHRGSVVTIGNFDGLHRGHQALIARLQMLSREHGLPPTALIFEPMPREFFAPDSAPPRVLGLRGKLRALAAAGVARVLCLRFDRRLAALDAHDFVQRVLVDGLGARALVVGADFRFGRGRSGDVDLLKRTGVAAGFSAEGLDAVRHEGLRCSSTALREALAQPELARAAALLGRPYRLVGRVRGGLKLGRDLGMPTANTDVPARPALAQGVYAVRAYGNGLPPAGAPGVASLGVRPTLNMKRCVLETHLFDFRGDLYGRELAVEPVEFLRPQQRFASLDALAAQMQADGAQARRILESKTT